MSSIITWTIWRIPLFELTCDEYVFASRIYFRVIERQHIIQDSDSQYSQNGIQWKFTKQTKRTHDDGYYSNQTKLDSILLYEYSSPFWLQTHDKQDIYLIAFFSHNLKCRKRYLLVSEGDAAQKRIIIYKNLFQIDFLYQIVF